MGSIAEALFRDGWQVTGSDEGVYAPMSDFLNEAGIRVTTPYDAANLPDDVELVVVGKRVWEGNPELQEARDRGLSYCSFPVLLRDRFLNRSRNAVVAGGVGKTTTTAMLTWILEHSGRSPNYFIGGMANNLRAPARLGESEFSVLEGDEYASCFDDSSAKFLHYHPEVILVTNLLEDHPDLYDGLESLQRVFLELAGKMPETGCLILSDEDEASGVLAEAVKGRVVTTGFTEDASSRITALELTPEGSSFHLEGTPFHIPQFGRMNVRNAAMAALGAAHFGVTLEESAEAMALFSGVRNRQESREVGGCVVIGDKATHPDALGELYEAVRQGYPNRRLISVIQPRATGGGGWVYQQRLPVALSKADHVILAEAYEHEPEQEREWEGGGFSNDKLASEVSSGSIPVSVVRSLEEIPVVFREVIRDGDVLVLTLPEQAVELGDAIEAALRQRL
jgi:UDP-N-acetylmuramate: L-alanyl-gamma-D-glutamyl-meso-diaminopimelate ligase